MSALSSDKVDKYECLIVEDTPPSDQSRILEQGKFTYSHSRKAFKNKQKLLKIKEKNK